MRVVIEADEAGRLALPAEVLGEAKPHGKYVVEITGTRLMISPEEAAHGGVKKLTPEQWEAQWRIVQEEVSKSWPAGVSATDVVSEMRR